MRGSIDRLVPLTAECPPPLRRAVRWGSLLLLAGLLAHAALTVTAGGGSAVKSWLYSAEILGAGVVCGVRAVAIRRDRDIWALLSLGIVLSSIGNLVYYSVLVGMDEPPYPSWADFFWVLWFPPTYAALALLVSRHLRHMPRSIWLDGAIGALALGALGAGVVLPSIVASTVGARPMALATALVYPSGDLILLMMVVVTVALSGWRAGGAWGLIGLGLALTALADTIYCLRVALSTYVDGTLLDSLWPAGMLLLAFAAWQPARPVRARLEGAAALAIPYAFTLVALALLIVDHFRGVSGLAVGLATGSVALAGYRTLRTFTELRDLGDTRRLALTDDLTGLGNRRDLQRRLDALAIAGDGAVTALLLIDLDRFKELNDTLGHAAGDRLLEHVADRLRDATPPGAAVCRLGGDEFAVLMPVGTGGRAGVQAARRAREAIQRPLRLHGITLQVDGSVGVAAYPTDADSASELLQRADIAMYAAKRSGTGVRRYEPAVDPRPRERLALFGELRSAIEGRQLVLHYQPQCNLVTGKVTSVEALVRWEHPDLGLLGPDAFIPVAERTELMRPLTAYVVERALRQLVDWQHAGLHLAVAVNIAVPNLLDPTFPATVASILARTGVAPACLTLELTENVAMRDAERAAAALDELRAIGVRLSLDDFGTGHSSLARLKRLPLDELKIDRAFVMSMGTELSDLAIVRSTIELARNLGLDVVAEGVEDDGALRTLAALGCQVAQGYHIARPMPPEGMLAWLDEPPWQARLAPEPSPGHAARLPSG